MFVTRDVLRLSGWLKADALCRVVPEGGGCDRKLRAGHARGHLEHLAHVRDAGGVPAGNVRIEVLQAVEEPTHVGDGRDVPVGDGTVRRRSTIRVYSVERLDGPPQGTLAREAPPRQATAAGRWVWVPARSTGSHCSGHATPLISDEACPVTSSECRLGSEARSMQATRDAAGTVRKLQRYCRNGCGCDRREGEKRHQQSLLWGS